MRGLEAALFLLALGACARSGPDDAALLGAEPLPVLSAYGLFEDARADLPADGVIAYDLINPLFSDHAEKHRYVYVPKGASAKFDPREAFDFPVGSVLIKTFAYAPDMRMADQGAYKIETRLLIRQTSGWVAYPYVWNEAGTEATYAPAGATRAIKFIAPDGTPEAIDYQVPNRNQCKTCHQAGDAIQPIGPKARNLDHVGPQGTRQLEDWRARRLLTGLPDDVTPVAAIDDVSAPLDARARAYLDIQCGHCHKEKGSASNTGLWLEADQTDAIRLGIGKHPVAAGRGAGDKAAVIVPGAPDASILPYRMASTEAGVAMPELGRQLSDEDGVKLITEWIASLETD